MMWQWRFGGDTVIMEKSVQKISKLARRLLGPENVKTIVEVGAKDCVETMGFSANFPKAQIYAFECNPATLPACRKRVASVKNVTLIEKAVSDRDGEVTFFPIDQEKTETPWADGNPGASSLLVASGKYKKEKYVQNEIRVQSTTFASFFGEKKIERVDFLWMDIQGAELMALQSAGAAISKIKIIHTEVEFMEIYQGQPLFMDIKKYLNGQGFSLYGFNYFGRYFADAIFVNNSIHVAGLSFRDKVMYPFYKYFWSYVLFALRLPAKPFRSFAGNVQP
jgi:FkbM family methyltransferase